MLMMTIYIEEEKNTNDLHIKAYQQGLPYRRVGVGSLYVCNYCGVEIFSKLFLKKGVNHKILSLLR